MSYSAHKNTAGLLRSCLSTLLIFGILSTVTYILSTQFSIDIRRKTWKNTPPIPQTPNLARGDLQLVQPFQLPLHYKTPISPLATLNHRIYQAYPPLNKSQINELLRSGAGLEKITLSGGTHSWKEHGITYIPTDMINRTKSKFIEFFHADYESYIPFNKSLFFEGKDDIHIDMSQRKIIAGRLVAMPKNYDLVPLQGCPDFPCVYTSNDSKYLHNASAVIFNGQKIGGRVPERRPDQIFIYFIYEPLQPWWGYKRLYLRDNISGWQNAFNWTMSYHTDADIFMPYGVIRPRPVPTKKNYTIILDNKTKLVAIMTSHCATPGRREEYIQELQKYIPVDVYGHCGPYHCHSSKDNECVTNIGREYKFYLSFESNMCDSYITEKFFRMFQTDAIVVTRGHNSYYKHAPSETFINAADFESPKALAERLIYLDNHYQEYLDLLKEKDKYFVSFETRERPDGNRIWVKSNWEFAPMCEICQRLWNLDKYAKHYTNIKQWYDERKCYEPTDI